MTADADPSSSSKYRTWLTLSYRVPIERLVYSVKAGVCFDETPPPRILGLGAGLDSFGFHKQGRIAVTASKVLTHDSEVNLICLGELGIEPRVSGWCDPAVE
jgi:hypothetical protein